MGVVFNLGSMFFHALNEDAVSGMADHIIASGKSPLFTEGPKPQIETIALTAEPGNPAAHRMYMRIGFTKAGHWIAVSFQ